MKAVADIRRPAVALAAVAITLLLAACGSGNGVQDQLSSGADSSPDRGAAQAASGVPANAPVAAQPGPEGASASSATAKPVGEPTAPVQSTLEDSGEDRLPTESPAPAVRETPEIAAKDPGEAAAQASTPVPTAKPAAGVKVGGEVGDRAPEFQAIANWINSEPLTMEGLRGNVVLIDFWTYTCVNCIRTLPYLKDWYSKYAGKGLVIVGVHSPEFEFEKLTENVVSSVTAFELEYPIAQDNAFGTWRAYSNRFWPAKYLVDQDGTVRYVHFGEGAYDETEVRIRDLLEEAGADLSGVAVNDAPPPETDPRARTGGRATGITREIYGGYRRNASSQGIYVADPLYYDEPERVFEYHDNGFHQNQFIYLQGLWFNGLEELRHARRTEDYEDHIALKFFATSVNAVINFEGEEPFDVNVTIDGRPLLPGEAGTDLMISEGRSFFTVDQARLYEVVALPEFGGHELTLSSNSPDFAFFAFTFGAYTEGL
jgi:thiol-disulfide isomerase/thioredoxin